MPQHSQDRAIAVAHEHQLTIFGSQSRAPVYVVATDGEILELSEPAMALLELPQDRAKWPNFRTFYENGEDREHLLRTAVRGKGAPVAASVPFVIGGTRKRITIVCSAVVEDGGSVLCHTGMLLPASSDHSEIRDVLEMQSKGVFELSADLRLVDGTEQFRESLGWDPLQSDVTLRSLVEAPADADRLESDLATDQLPAPRTIALKTTSGMTREFYLQILPKKALSGSLTGFWGTLSEPPREALLVSALDAMAVGVYEVRHEPLAVADLERTLLALDPTKQRISYFNETFAKLVGVSESVLVNFPSIADVFGDLRALPAFFRGLVAAHTDRGEPKEFPTVIIPPSGEARRVTLLGRLVVDADGRITGRVVVVRQMSFEESRSTWLAQRLTFDVGAVWHSYSSTLNNLGARTQSAINFLALSAPSTEYDDASLQGFVSRVGADLVSAIRNVTSRLESDERARQQLGEAGIATFELTAANIAEHILPQDNLNVAMAHIRTVAPTILEILRKLAASHLVSHDLQRNVERPTMALYHMAVSHSLRDAFQTMVELEISIANARSFMTEYQQQGEESSRRTAGRVRATNRDVVQLRGVLQLATSRIADFAAIRNVRLRLPTESDLLGVYVEGSQRELARAFENVFHNAIKYSWSRPDPRNPRFVSVTALPTHTDVSVAIEDFGVPISPDEITNRRIFELGYRGLRASDRNRPGTGIGLADTERLLRRYGGSIIVTSEEVKSEYPGSQRPHITTFTITLRRLRRGNTR